MDTNNKTENKKKVVLVTGATGAIGKAIARNIALSDSYEVVILARSQIRGEKAVVEIKKTAANNKVRYEFVDLAIYESIKQLRNNWTGPADILINNAATTPRTRQETSEGIELQFATNVMGYFWLINAFSDLLSKSADGRVVNVASYWAGGLDIGDLEFRKRLYNNDLAYRQSKQADRMLTVAFADRLQNKVSVNACHPGDVNSVLSNNLGFGGHESPDQGAKTPVFLATNRFKQKVTGKYFERMQEVKCSFSQDGELINRLFEKCLTYC